MATDRTQDTDRRYPQQTQYVRLGLWRIERQPDPAQTQYLEAIHRFLIPFFCRIFRTREKELEPCDILCDRGAATPMLILNRTPIAIRLNVHSTVYWCQVLFQWSHELGHFFTRQHKPRSRLTQMIAWFEETFCEALSNLALEYAADHWSECDLTSQNPDYAAAIRTYLSNLLNGHDDVHPPAHDVDASPSIPHSIPRTFPRSVLRDCVTLEDLANLEKTCTADRDGRMVERDLLYQHLRRVPSSAATVARYARYIHRSSSAQERSLGPLLVDFDRWEAVATPDQYETLQLLRRIQPNVRESTKTPRPRLSTIATR